MKRDDLRLIELGGGALVPRASLRKKILTARQELLWYPWLGRRRAKKEGADVYHCPTLRAPITRGRPPLVLTVHDLVPMLFPETMSTWSRVYTRATLRSVLNAADVIVAVSQTTANDLNRLLKVSPARIRVVWNGVDEIFSRSQDTTSPTVIGRPYVLFVGTPEPRKNLPRLVEAMRQLRARGFAERLVIAGSGGWGRLDLSPEDAEFVGSVPDDELVKLYQNASCVALPSLYEGFGFTLVEGMAAGTPVVTSRTGSLPEIAGGAAVLVDPHDALAIAAGIEEAILDREHFIRKGRQRAELFRWDRTATAMSEIYREVA